MEIFGMVVANIVQFLRIHIGSFANKTESSNIMVWFFIMTFLNAFGFAFYLSLQTYVLMAEVIIGAIGVSLLTLEFLFALGAFMRFKNNEKG